MVEYITRGGEIVFPFHSGARIHPGMDNSLSCFDYQYSITPNMVQRIRPRPLKTTETMNRSP